MRVLVQTPSAVQPPEMAVFMGAAPAYVPAAADAESRRLADVLGAYGVETVAPADVLAGHAGRGVPLTTLRALARQAVRADGCRRGPAEAAIEAWDAPALARLIVTQPSLELVPDAALRAISPDAAYERFRIAPLHGLMFPRDHFIALGGTVVPARLNRRDRCREVAVMTACLEALGARVRTLPDDGAPTLEGGDFARNGRVSILGTGFRTTASVAGWLTANGLVETPWLILARDGLRRPAQFHMDHVLALGPDFALVADDRLDDTRAVACEVLRVNAAGATTVARELTLRRALAMADVEALALEPDAVAGFAANALVLGGRVLIAPDTLPRRAGDMARARGLAVETIAFAEHHKQFGGVHCAAHPLDGPWG